MSFIKSAGASIVASVCAIQAFAWLFGYFDELTELAKTHRELTILTLFVYIGMHYIGYDAKERVQKGEYEKRLKGAALRKAAIKGTALPTLIRKRRPANGDK